METGAWRLGIVLGIVFGVGACGGGGGTGEPSGDEPPSTITVSGTVLEQEAYGAVTQPDAGATVVVVGHGEAITDAAGRFVVPEVTPPYDVVVYDGTRSSLALYQGLTRSDPVLRGTEPEATALRSAGVSGDVVGGVGWPLPIGYPTVVAYGNPDRLPTGNMPARKTDGHYDYILTWTGADSMGVGGVALQYRRTSGGPEAYLGFGVSTGVVTNGSGLSDVDIVLAPVDAQAVSGTLEIPDGYGLAGLGLGLLFDTGPELFVEGGSWTSGPFTMLVPDLPNAAPWLRLVGGAPSGSQVFAREIVEPGLAGVSLRLPEAVDPLLPPDGATGVTHETTFAVTDGQDGVVRVRYAPTGDTDGPVVWLTAASGSWRIPDLSTYDVLIPSGSTYTWRTWGYGPATVDDLCDPTPFTERSPHWETRSGWFEFTTGP